MVGILEKWSVWDWTAGLPWVSSGPDGNGKNVEHSIMEKTFLGAVGELNMFIILSARSMYLAIYRGHIWAHLSCT